MKLLSRLGSNLKIGTRVGAGFVLILTLLGAVAGLGYLALSNAERSTTELGSIAQNMARVGIINTSFAQLRRRVLIVANTGSEEAEKEARNLLRTINETGAQATKAFLVEERRQRIERILTKVNEYTVVFEDIVKKRAEQKRTVEDVLRPLGAQLQNALSDLVRSALAENDYTVAAYAGEAETNFLMTRLNMTQFVAAPSQTNLAKAAEEYDAKVGPALKRLREVVKTPELQARVQELIALAEKYSAARPISATSVVEVTRLHDTVANAIGAQLREELDALSKMQLDALENVRSDSVASLESALQKSLWISGIAVIVGALLAWLIGRGISRPLRGLVTLLQRMAKGEEIEITGTERKDEVGETARAVNDIKVMLAEKARQEAEAKVAQDKLTAAERDAAMQKVAQEFEATVGGIVQAAVAGDFSQRVDVQGKTGLVLNVGTAINSLCEQCRQGARRSHQDARLAGRGRSHAAHHGRLSGQLRDPEGQCQQDRRADRGDHRRDQAFRQRGHQRVGGNLHRHHRPLAADRGAGREPGRDLGLDGRDRRDREEERRERPAGQRFGCQCARGRRSRRPSGGEGGRGDGSDRRTPRARSPTSSA